MNLTELKEKIKYPITFGVVSKHKKKCFSDYFLGNIMFQGRIIEFIPS